ncbi:hypothetical protein NDI45_27050 [Leptolyngbya sp. GB1-A1]|uniref:hypothetical protein n=1 Tax=Leptolyngbya sp. GB1-A1 TaxID=2933908 RepID=UPI00329873F6
MRKPIVFDHVWLKEDGGTPWVVTAIQGNSAIVACAHEPDRTEPLSNLKIQGLPDEKNPPGLLLYEAIEEKYLAFAQAYPNQIDELDLHPIHLQAFKEKLATLPKLPAPVPQILIGMSVTLDSGCFAGKTGTVLCYNPRTDSYIVRCPNVSYLLLTEAVNLCS